MGIWLPVHCGQDICTNNFWLIIQDMNVWQCLHTPFANADMKSPENVRGQKYVTKLLFLWKNGGRRGLLPVNWWCFPGRLLSVCYLMGRALRCCLLRSFVSLPRAWGTFFFSSLLSAWHVSIIIIFIECVLFFKVISILETFSTFTDYRINSLNVIIEYLLASGCPTECFQTPFYVDFIKESVATHAVYTLCLLLLTVKSFLY